LRNLAATGRPSDEKIAKFFIGGLILITLTVVFLWRSGADKVVISAIATTPAKAQATLQKAGFINVVTGDSAICSPIHKIGRNFNVTDLNGVILTGKVCCSYLPVIGDDCAIRFDKTTSEIPEVVFYFNLHCKALRGAKHLIVLTRLTFICIISKLKA